MLIVYTVLREAGQHADGSWEPNPADIAAWSIVVACLSVAVFQLNAYYDAYQQFVQMHTTWLGDPAPASFGPGHLCRLVFVLITPAAGTWWVLWRNSSRRGSPCLLHEGQGHVLDALAVTLWFVLLPTIGQQFLAHKFSDTTSPSAMLRLMFCCAAWSGSGFAVILWVLRRKLVPVREPGQAEVGRHAADA